MSTTSADPLLALRGLRAGYSGRAILPPVDLEVRPREMWALVGRNGGGKSTLLRTLLGLLPRVGGKVELADGLRVAYVPQRGDYDPTVPARVIDFVGGGLDRGWSFAIPFRGLTRREAVRAALRDTDTLRLRRQSFARLSEGQRQRVLVARALVSEPQLMVLDEPTSAMDPIHEREVFELLAALRARRDLAVLVASHHMEFVPRYATHAVLVDRENEVVEAGAADAVLRSPAFRARYGHLAEVLTGELSPVDA